MNTTTKTVGEIVANEPQPLVLLSQVKLADFLATGALVMQLKSHQIQLSNQHRWADDLPEAITRSLLGILDKIKPNYHFEINNIHWQENAKAHINIYIDQFTVLANQTTLTSGTFWFLNKHNKLIRKQTFRIIKPLKKDGYNHAVAQLKLSLSELAEQIKNAITQIH